MPRDNVPLIGFLRGVPRLEVPSIWPETATILAPAVELSHGRWHLDDVLSYLTDERMQLWVFEVGYRVRTACVTHITQYPRCKALQIIFIGGEGFGLWPQWFERLSAWGRELGCRFIEGDGRFGWEREMKAAGLRKIGSRYMKEL